MAIYVIADLHLALGQNKPMDIFGPIWINHEQKIKENWMNKVKNNDLVILPGDFSWAMHLQDTILDFKYLSDLPGKKILLKGNHDYWWSTLKKMEKYLHENNYSNIEFLQNNSFEYENKIIVGTRGWSVQEEDAEKIIRRENLRLKLSIEDGIKKYGTDKEFIVFMHYPPFNSYEEKELSFIKTMQEYGIKRCFYGHIHGREDTVDEMQGIHHGIEFKLISSDFLKFDLFKICD